MHLLLLVLAIVMEDVDLSAANLRQHGCMYRPGLTMLPACLIRACAYEQAQTLCLPLRVAWLPAFLPACLLTLP